MLTASPSSCSEYRGQGGAAGAGEDTHTQRCGGGGVWVGGCQCSVCGVSCAINICRSCPAQSEEMEDLVQLATELTDPLPPYTLQPQASPHAPTINAVIADFNDLSFNNISVHATRGMV